MSKSAGPDGLSGRVLKNCYKELSSLFVTFTGGPWIPVKSLNCGNHQFWFQCQKKPKPSLLNDSRPVALTSRVMMRFECIVKDILVSLPGANMDPLQFA